MTLTLDSLVDIFHIQTGMIAIFDVRSFHVETVTLLVKSGTDAN